MKPDSALRGGLRFASVAWPLAVGLMGAATLDDYWFTIGIGVGTFAVAALGLSVLMGLGGMLSLAQGSFIGLGMYAVAKSPWAGFGGIGYALLVGAVVSLVVGLLLVRLHHYYFALGTLAVALVFEGIARGYPDQLGGPSGLVVVNEPPLGLATPRSYFLAMWFLVFIVLAVIGVLRRSRFGRGARVLGHDPALAGAVGVRPVQVRISLFMFASIVATLAGSLYGHFLFFVSPPALGLRPNIDVLVAVALGGTTAAGSVVGAAIVRLLPEVSGTIASANLVILGGCLVVLVLVFPQGIRLPHFRRFAAWSAPPVVALKENRQPKPDLVAVNNGKGNPELEARDLTVAFGGLHAVDGVDLTARAGQVVGLIGPNGAGKTTLFNLLAGSIPADHGLVRLCGHDISQWRPERRAAAGLARTFQIPRAVPHTTVIEAAVSGAYSRGRGGLLMGLTGFDLPERRRLEQAGWRSLARVGLEGVGHERVEMLGTGRRKLLEVARALASEPSVVLLDEPAAGLENNEVDQLGSLIRDLGSDGLAVVLVEHGMDLVMSVCDEVVVLESGRVIARDLPGAVREDPEVIRAYLG